MFSAYALRVIMFAPNASPVVKRQRTWHIGPTTCVFASRSTAYRQLRVVGGSQELAHRRHLILDPAGEYERVSGVLADEARCSGDTVGDHICSGAAGLGDRLRSALDGRGP